MLEFERQDGSAEFRDLAPEIVRRRLVLEGTRLRAVEEAEIKKYLGELSHVCGMRPLIEPVTHRSERYGWAGWVHWETSGAHFYAWEHPLIFFSVDIYACKEFETIAVIEFTQDFFDAVELVAKEF